MVTLSHDCPSSGELTLKDTPYSKVHGDNMGPIWGRQNPDGPHVGPMNFAIWDTFLTQPAVNIAMNKIHI